jgi:uncharacterized membrane protein YdjX (TVP38/TMEM64 family)
MPPSHPVSELSRCILPMSEIKQWLAETGAQYPWAIFFAIAILPGLGFPSSVLLLLAGAVWGASWSSCAIAFVAVLINICWSHLAAAGPGKSLVARLLGERWLKWSEIPRTDFPKLACVLRVTPGIPLFVQNYLSGLLGIPLGLSLMIAAPVTGIYVCGFVLTGGALFQGKFGHAMAGLLLLVAAALLVKLVRARLALRNSPRA